MSSNQNIGSHSHSFSSNDPTAPQSNPVSPVTEQAVIVTGQPEVKRDSFDILPKEMSYIQSRQIELQAYSEVAPSPESADSLGSAERKQIEVFNSVMKHGILTPAAAQNKGLIIVRSADEEKRVGENPEACRVCTNRITANPNGIAQAIHSSANGALPVALERKDDSLVPLESVPTSFIDLPPFLALLRRDQRVLDELAERAHSTMLFVCDITGKNQLEVVSDQDEKLQYEVENTPSACKELHINYSILPINITHVFLPEKLKGLKAHLEPLKNLKVIFVPSQEIKVKSRYVIAREFGQ